MENKNKIKLLIEKLKHKGSPNNHNLVGHENPTMN